MRFRPKSEFARNVLTLMTGTTVAQALPIAVTPVLTRIYTPEDFGLFALCLAITSIFSVFVTGRYDLSIMQPKHDEDAGHLCNLSLILTIIISTILMVIMIFSGKWIVIALNRPDFINWLYFIPLLTIVFGTYSSFNYLLNRKKHYSRISKNKMLQSFTTSSLSAGLGTTALGSYTLVLAVLLGYIISLSLLISKYFTSLPKLDYRKTIQLAKKYKSYPLFDIPATLFSTLSHQMPAILFVPFFGPVYSGYYYLVERVFLSPIGLISGSIGSVFRQRALEDKNKNGNYKSIFLKTFYRLVLFAIPIFSILALFSEDIFVIVLGKEWKIAGEYAQILCPMFFLKFIVSPLSYSLYISDRLHYDLVGQLLYSALILTSILIGYTNKDITLTIKLISISGSFIYLSYLFLSFMLSKEYENEVSSS